MTVVYLPHRPAEFPYELAGRPRMNEIGATTIRETETLLKRLRELDRAKLNRTQIVYRGLIVGYGNGALVAKLSEFICQRAYMARAIGCEIVIKSEEDVQFSDVPMKVALANIYILRF